MSGIQFCSYFSTEQTSRISRYASYLLTDLKGLSKVIAAACAALMIADYATIGKEPTNARICAANDWLSDTKSVLKWAKTSEEVESLWEKWGRIGDGGDEEPLLYHRGVLEITRWAGCVRKALSVLSDSFFKPMMLIGKFINLQPAAQVVNETGQVVSMLKSGIKVVYCCGKLYSGSKRPEKKIIDMTLEIWSLTHSILNYCVICIHPLVDIALAVSKSVFGLVEVWIHTT